MYTDANWYLCGPMSGIPHYNIPAFDAAARALRAKGLTIVSPAELDAPHIREACLQSRDGKDVTGHGSWGDFLARDVKLVSDGIHGLILLPGWERSRGARLEVFVGLLCDKAFAAYDPFAECAYPYGIARGPREILMENMPGRAAPRFREVAHG